MAAAGISSDNYADANWLINAESSWNPGAIEPTTGACHLEQSNPCGKDGCFVADMVCQLAWSNRYVLTRYGSWANAVAFHKLMGYY